MGGSIGGLVGSIFGGNSAPSSPQVNVYQPTGTGTADTQLQNLLTQNSSLVGANNPYNTFSPQFAALYNQIYSNPFQAGAQTAANTAGASYGTVGNQSLNNSTALSSSINPGLAAAGSVLNTAFDPQNALYAQTLQKVNDQSNVANAQYGLTGQQAAGNVQQADSNFNIDWQNNELQRQLSGLTGYGAAQGAAGAAGTAAQNVGSAGAGAQVQAGSIPYQQSVAGTNNQAAALQQYITALLGPQTSSESTIGDLAGYLGQGIDASTSGNTAALNDYYAQLKGAGAGALGGSQLGSGISSFLGSSGSGGAFDFLNPSTSAASGGNAAAGSSGFDWSSLIQYLPMLAAAA